MIQNNQTHISQDSHIFTTVLQVSQQFSKKIEWSLNEHISLKNLMKNNSFKIEEFFSGTLTVQLVNHLLQIGYLNATLVKFRREIKGNENDHCLLRKIDVDMTKNLVYDFDGSVVGLGLVINLNVNELYPVHDLGSIVQIF